MPRTSPSPEQIISEACLVSRARLLSRALTAIYHDALRPLGLSPTQMSLLVCISRLGLASQAQVAKHLLLEKSTLSRDLAVLRRLGWIEQRSGADGRSTAVVVTVEGRRRIRSGYPAWQRAQASATALLGDEGARALCSAATRARAAAA